jgi:hypothetical protein
VDGIFSAVKRLLRREYRTLPGDVIFPGSPFDAERRILTVTGAHMGPHDPNIPELGGLFGERARRAGRLFIDQFFTGVLQYGSEKGLGLWDPPKNKPSNPIRPHRRPAVEVAIGYGSHG